MRPYLAFFRLRFVTGLQYRAAALAGVATQFAWGFMRILLFQAFYEADAASFPMDFPALVSYIWLQQAFLTMLTTWSAPGDLFESVSTGQVAYELCRPMDLYAMWWVKTCAARFSKAALRFLPVLVITSLLPAPYGLSLPQSWETLLLFLPTLVLGFALVVCVDLIMYGMTFYTVSPWGIRVLFAAVSDFLMGGVLPLSFFPGWLRRVVDLLPYSLMQNAALEIYGGTLAGPGAFRALGLQLVWLLVLITLGRLLFRKGIRQTVLQGG